MFGRFLASFIIIWCGCLVNCGNIQAATGATAHKVLPHRTKYVLIRHLSKTRKFEPAAKGKSNP
jgi:hypothetical protein